MLPSIVPEQLIHLFNFYLNGTVQRGMRHNGELYGLLQELDASHQAKAYQIACELAEHGAQVTITKSRQRYAIWICLRSPNYSLNNYPALAGVA
jgi:hypothetical protein